jgi:hypothetical protein
VAPILVAAAVPRRIPQKHDSSGGSRIEAMINPTNELSLGADPWSRTSLFSDNFKRDDKGILPGRRLATECH